MKDLTAEQALADFRARRDVVVADLSDSIRAHLLTYIDLNLADTETNAEKRCVLTTLGGTSKVHISMALQYLRTKGIAVNGREVAHIFKECILAKTPDPDPIDLE